MERTHFITLSVYNCNQGTVKPTIIYTGLIGFRTPTTLAYNHEIGLLNGTHITIKNGSGLGLDVLESVEEINALIDKAGKPAPVPDPNARRDELSKLLIRYEVANTWWLAYITNAWLQQRLGIWIARRVKRKQARYDQLVKLQRVNEAIRTTPF